MKNDAAPLVLDGFELSARDKQGRAWSYRPKRPVLERRPDGAPMLQILEAGSTAFLQCTARVALDESARAALLDALKRERPNAQTLDAAPLGVERIALEVKSGDHWVAVADSRGSGNAPWIAALAATLDADALAAMKAAIAGEKGRARLTARAAVPGAPGAWRHTEAAAKVQIRTPAGGESAGFATTADERSPATAPVPLELGADIAEFFPGGGPNR